MIRIYAIQYLPIGGFRERNHGTIRVSTAEGVDQFSITRNIMYRDGNEPKISAPKGAKCNEGNHRVREGSPVYELGKHFACPDHIYMVPTLDGLKAIYADTLRYSDVFVEDELGKRPLSEL